MKLTNLKAHIVGRDPEADPDDYFTARIEFTQGELRGLLTLMGNGMINSHCVETILSMAKIHEELSDYRRKGQDLVYAEGQAFRSHPKGGSR
jgi:hypothetical protein